MFYKIPTKTIQEIQIIRELSMASLKSRFRQTWGGLFWVLMNPILTYLVHCFFLASILKVNLPNLPLYLIGGVLPWTFFSTTIDMAPNTLINSRQLLFSFSISPFVIVSIMVMENFITFIMSFLILTIILLFFYNYPLTNIFFFPFAVLFLFIFTALFATSIAILNVFYRDVRFIVSFCLSILFFMTPVLYPEEKFPADYKWIVDYNLIYKVILPLRSCIYEFNSTLDLTLVLNAAMAIVTMFLITTLIWKKYKNELVKRL